MNSSYSQKIHEKHLKNFGWNIHSVAKLYKKENPEWTDQQCTKKAEEVVKELNRLNRKSHRDNKKYYSNVIGLDEMQDNYEPMDGSFGYGDIINNMDMDDLFKMIEED